MADEIEKPEEAKVEETKTEEVKVISQQVLDDMKTFDAKLDGDDNDSAGDEDEDDGEEEVAKVAVPAAKEEATVKTAEEKEIDEVAAKIEKEAAEEKAPEPKKVEEAKEEEKYDCGLDPDEYDEGVIKKFNEEGQARLNTEKALKEENARLHDAVMTQNRQRTADWLDSKINALGADFHETLGEGEFEDLEPASAQMENHIKLGTRMGVIVKAYQQAGKPIPSRNKLFTRAVSDLFNKEINKSKTEADTIQKLNARASQVIGKGSRKGATISAAEQTLQAMKEFDAKIDA